jgi:hypothetical protein
MATKLEQIRDAAYRTADERIDQYWDELISALDKQSEIVIRGGYLAVCVSLPKYLDKSTPVERIRLKSRLVRHYCGLTPRDVTILSHAVDASTYRTWYITVHIFSYSDGC